METPRPPLKEIQHTLVSAADYEAAAQAHLTAQSWAYLQGGAADELSVQDNLRAWQDLRLLPQVLCKLSGGHTRTQLFGEDYAHPLLVAPIAYQRMFHESGEMATAQGAGVMETPFVLSAMSSTPLHEVAQHASAPLWFQLYWQGTREASLALVRLAEDAGYRVLVVTVDAPLSGVRNRERRAGFSVPPDKRAVHMYKTLPAPADGPGRGGLFDTLMTAAPDWEDIAWLATQTRLPIVLKGILHPRDVRRAIDIGAQGIVVSNHGGRVLDTTPAPAELLPLLRQIAGDALVVLVDGGIRRGSDIFKAIALGADAVMVGRPVMHALATAGALGVAHLLRILREELEITMALCGCRTLQEIDGDVLMNPPG